MPSCIEGIYTKGRRILLANEVLPCIARTPKNMYLPRLVNNVDVINIKVSAASR